MKKQVFFIGAALSVLLVSTFLMMYSFGPQASIFEGTIDALNYDSSVCTYVTRADGTVESLGCSHNLLTDAGKNAIRAAMTTSDGVAFQYIGLCNATAGCNATNAADSTLYNEFPAGATGLNRTNAATYLKTTTGNWSYSRTFTAGADNMVTNKTGIFNAASGGTMLAVNTFTTATLQTNDQITVNWSIWVA